LAQQKKARKVGRPKLPKGEAKGWIVPVRFATDDLKAIEAAARANNQTVSEWVRMVLPLEAKEHYKGYLIELATRNAREGGFTSSGWITKQKDGAEPISVVAPGRHLTKQAALEFGIAWCKEKIDL
jgi:hypothetical protein